MKSNRVLSPLVRDSRSVTRPSSGYPCDRLHNYNSVMCACWKSYQISQTNEPGDEKENRQGANLGPEVRELYCFSLNQDYPKVTGHCWKSYQISPTSQPGDPPRHPEGTIIKTHACVYVFSSIPASFWNLLRVLGRALGSQRRRRTTPRTIKGMKGRGPRQRLENSFCLEGAEPLNLLTLTTLLAV